MNYLDLDDFQEEIDAIERFFTEMAAREDQLLTYGIGRATQWDSFQAIQEKLPSFEAQVYELLAFVRPIDRQLHESVRELVNSSKLTESIISIQVSLRIEAERSALRERSYLALIFQTDLPFLAKLFRKRQLFSEEVISIRSILVALGQLRNLVKRASDEYIRRWSHDSDVFKPSNLDEDKILDHIELAIAEIEKNSLLPESDRKQLVEYLYKAKSELAQERPSWSKIVGALVIAATITGGIATAPQAFENIDSVIKYILGTSTKSYIPKTIPLLDGPVPVEESHEQDESRGPIRLA